MGQSGGPRQGQARPEVIKRIDQALDLGGAVEGTRREPDPLGPPSHPGRDLPRREVSADEGMTCTLSSAEIISFRASSLPFIVPIRYL